MFECLKEAIEAIGRIIAEFTSRLPDILNEVKSLLNEQSAIWKPYRCRICGRMYSTKAEVRSCMARHQRQSTKAFSRDMNKHLSVKFSGARMVPRNREATLRSTELRRYRAAK